MGKKIVGGEEFFTTITITIPNYNLEWNTEGLGGILGN